MFVTAANVTGDITVAALLSRMTNATAARVVRDATADDAHLRCASPMP
jgi:hypothetical protein